VRGRLEGPPLEPLEPVGGGTPLTRARCIGVEVRSRRLLYVCDSKVKAMSWGLDKIISGKGGVGTSLACVHERRNVLEEALELAARYAPSLAYPFEHHPNASFPPW